MLENCGDEELALLDNRATVMIWLYNSRTIGRDAGKLIQRLKKFGIEATGAAAARCHDGNDVQNVPNVTARLSNIRQWAETAVKTELPQAASTNWATAFAMGAPYGIFETSLYPAWFSGEKFWNVNGDEASFLARFLAVFHGIDLEKHSLLLENCRADDYYDVIFHIEDGVTKNRGIAEHLRAVKLFELGLRRLNSTDSYIYRYKRFRGEKGDMVSLKNRIKEYTEEFSKSLPELYRTLKLFLPGEMADMYMEARLAVPDFMNEHFYKGVIAELELG
jgi:hypothetical protein